MTAAATHLLTGAYALDSVDGAERRAFESHLRFCPDCAAETDTFRETAVLLGRLDPRRPSATVRGTVIAAATRDPLRHSWWSRSWAGSGPAARRLFWRTIRA